MFVELSEERKTPQIAAGVCDGMMSGDDEIQLQVTHSRAKQRGLY